MKTGQTSVVHARKSYAPHREMQIGSNATGNRFAVSALSLALLAVFTSPVATAADNNPITVSGSTAAQTSSDETISNSAGNGTPSGPGYAVQATNGAQVTLSGDTVQETYAGAKTFGIEGNGNGTRVQATNTNVVVVGADPTDNPNNLASGNAPIGVDSQSGALVTLNGGSVTMSGTSGGTIGVRAEGATLQAIGTNISTVGDVGYAAFAWANSSAGANLDLSGGSVSTQGQLAYGLYSQDSLSAGSPVQANLTAEGVSVTTSGQGANAAEAYTGGTLNLSGGTSLTTSGAQASGIDASGTDANTGAPSKATATDTTVTTTGVKSYGVTANGPGADVNFTGGSITTSGKGSTGALASAGGTIELSGTDVNVNFKNNDPIQPIDPDGLYATGAGSAITATNTNLTMASDGDGNGDPAVGAQAQLGASISLSGGFVHMTGDTRAYGVQALGGNSNVTAQNTDISTAGTSSFGVYAYAGESGDPLNIIGPASVKVTGGNVTTLGDNSYGLLAVNDGATVNATSVNVTTGSADGSTGASAFGAEALGGGDIAISGGTITTNGAGASGLDASSADGVTGRGATLEANNVAVTANGTGSSAASVSDGGSMAVTGSTLTSTQGDGITVTNNGSVTLNGAAVNSTNGASIVSNLNDAGVKQDITIGGGSTLTQNDGTLLQVNRTSDGMDGTVNLTLQAGAVASGNVVDTDGLTNGTGTRAQGGQTNFVLDAGSSWTGSTQGLNNTSVGDGGSFTDNGSAPIAGDVQSGSNAQVTFNNQATIGGSVQSGQNSTVGFNSAAVIGQDVVGDGTAFAFAQTATIGRNVQATGGSTLAFAGAATIAGDVSATNSAFTFSNTAPTVIGGNLTLDNGSSTHGGTVATPISVAGNVVVNDSTFGGNVNVQGTLSGTNGLLAPGNPAAQTSGSVSNFAGTDRAVVRAAAQTGQTTAGNSLGTQTFGSISGFSGTYAAQVNGAGQSDEIVVHGNADLSGIALTLGQENGNGGYRINTPYTILETTNGGTVQNQFASAGLDASMANTLVDLAPLQYDPTDVKVQFTLDPQKIAAARSGLTQNQNAALSGAISVAGTNAAAATLFSTNIDRAEALNQISGEGYASTTAALIQDSHYIRDAADDRVRSSFAEPGAGAPVTTYGANVWTKGFGSWGHTDGTANAGRLSDSTGGFLIGVDGLVAPDWRVGVLGGYSHSDFDVDSRSFSAKSDNYHVGVYGGTQVGNLGFRAGAAYTWGNIDTNRSVAFPGFADSTKGAYDAGTTQAFGELGYQLHFGRIGIEPFANVAYVNLHTEGFSETGGDAALNLQADNVNTEFTTLGLRGSSDFSIGSADLTARGTLGWQHTYGQVKPASSVAFAGGQDFSVAGVPIVRDAAVIEVGLNATITKNASLGISYSGQLGNHTQDNGFTANLNYKF